MDVFSGKYLMALRTVVWSLAEIFWHGEKVEMKVSSRIEDNQT
jgi:hypothetical protein